MKTSRLLNLKKKQKGLDKILNEKMILEQKIHNYKEGDYLSYQNKLREKQAKGPLIRVKMFIAKSKNGKYNWIDNIKLEYIKKGLKHFLK